MSSREWVGRLGARLRRHRSPLEDEHLVTCLRGVIDRCGVTRSIDVGANLGRYSALLRHDVGFTGPIIALEPDPDLFIALCDRFRADAQWQGVGVAAGSSSSSGTLRRVTRAPGLNSLLDASVAGRAAFRAFDDVEVVPIATGRVDDLLADVVGADERLLLKIDTQGSEREVLAGSSGIMARVAVIQLEVPLALLYDAMATASELLGIIEREGFEVIDVFPGGRSGDGSRLLDLDVVAVRRDWWAAVPCAP